MLVTKFHYISVKKIAKQRFVVHKSVRLRAFRWQARICQAWYMLSSLTDNKNSWQLSTYGTRAYNNVWETHWFLVRCEILISTQYELKNTRWKPLMYVRLINILSVLQNVKFYVYTFKCTVTYAWLSCETGADK